MAAATKDHDLLIRIEENVIQIKKMMEEMTECQDKHGGAITNLQIKEAQQDQVIGQLKIDINKDVTNKNWTSGIITLIASIIAAVFGVNLKP
jgi:hypothetical protein